MNFMSTDSHCDKVKLNLQTKNNDKSTLLSCQSLLQPFFGSLQNIYNNLFLLQAFV